MEIPAKVREEAQWLIEMYGDHLEYLGKHQGADAFWYHTPGDIIINYSPVYLYENDDVVTLTGDIAGYVISLFVKDVSEL